MTISYFTEHMNKVDMMDYMLKYIADNFGNRPSANDGERMELEFLRQAVPKLREEMYGSKNNLSPGTSTGESERKMDSSQSEESDDDDDAVEDLPAQVAARNRGPRMSVSAEVFGKFNKKEDYVPPVHAKTAEQVAAIKQRMEGNFMFDTLNPVDTKAIIDAIEATSRKAGDVIIQQGDDGDNFYVVEEGLLTCTKRMKADDAEETFLKEYKPGESFGELALLYNAPRAATIVVKSDEVQLWSLDRNTFNHIIKSAVQQKREKYDQFLDQVEILKCMEKYERTKLADAFKEQWYEKGDYIIKEGDKNGDQFFMIIDGECVATKVLEPGKPAQVVKQYYPGEYFGERSLLLDAPRAANIIAESQVCVVSLDRSSFKRLMGPLEDILRDRKSVV